MLHKANPAELSQDPISQLSHSNDQSSNSITREHPKPRKILRVHFSPSKGFRIIDTPKFRMPKVQNKCTTHSTYSDGFEGEEAEPIRRFMPVRRPKQTPSFIHKITLRMGELTLVAEKQFAEVGERRVRRNAPERQVTPPDDAMHAEEGEPMLVDLSEQHVHGDVSHSHEDPSPNAEDNNTIKIAESDSPALHTAGSESPPLKNKNRLNHRMQFDDKVTICQESSTSTQRLSFGRRGSDKHGICQKLKMVPAQKKYPPKKHGMDTDLEVSQQLMMVSIRRRATGSKEDEEGTHSEIMDDSYSEPQSENGDDSEEEDDEGDITAEEDSEQDETERDEDEDEDEDIQVQEESITEETIGQRLHKELETYIRATEDKPNPSQQAKEGQRLPDAQSYANTSLGSNQGPALPEELVLDSDEQYVREDDTEKASNHHTLIHYVHIYHTLDDDSWRLRKPDPSSITMEIDEEILDSPSPPHARTRTRSLSWHQVVRRRSSGIGSQSLAIVRSRLSSPQFELTDLDQSQGSIELGDTGLISHSPNDAIPETQFVEEVPLPRESQQTFVPERDYFERASQQLQEPVRKLNLLRRKSTPARFYNNEGQKQAGTMAEGIAHSVTFRQTVSSPSKSTHPLLSLLEVTQSQERSLRALTWQASFDLGTVPGGRGRRMVSLPFTPPLKKQ
jgi:hypothetical protein